MAQKMIIPQRREPVVIKIEGYDPKKAVAKQEEAIAQRLQRLRARSKHQKNRALVLSQQEQQELDQLAALARSSIEATNRESAN